MEFYLERDEDETGVSGTGRIAHGVMFDDGRVSMRWLTEHASTTHYDNLLDVWRIHSHGGKTRLVPHKCWLSVINHGHYGASVVGFETCGDEARFFDLVTHQDGRVIVCNMHPFRPRVRALNHLWMSTIQLGFELGGGQICDEWGVLPPSLTDRDIAELKGEVE